MAGTKHDSGTIEHGVGRTALMVAAARAIETHRPDSLVQDGYAEYFVRATRVCEDWPLRNEQVPGGDADPLWGRLGRYFGLRTRVLDDFVLRATRAGGRQVVLLGAGLDSRAFRLDLPEDCVLFEIDREPVLHFKQDVLDTLGATTKTRRVPIAGDLRGDWAATLIDAGFDPAEPCVWLAEGLLLYLSADAERSLIHTVDSLSAEGSSLAFEVKLGVERPEIRANAVYTAAKQRIGVDLLTLFDRGSRPDSIGDLERKGWTADVKTPFDFTREFGRGPRPEPDDALASNRWVFAGKPRQ
ncbi:SAM-dependent methyltransferase [Amycolatopsis sp. QT-25]|uniref:SAM-dependent methyltransferase n=1 Tax=Amycolatopsis sp. QT-25 TaxID=3034022 RepID=UPI0023EB74D5|nr:SAM-dependent methyltransferase [Amycolatopsis sp. QT-25]WET82443.1 SAM-dependent methyltransferase [Amycolatopsis sp. QT-25]